MPAVKHDQSVPYNLFGVDVIMRDGNEEAVCPGCKVWVRLGPLYQADRKVIHAIPHVAPCLHYEHILKSGVFQNGEQV